MVLINIIIMSVIVERVLEHILRAIGEESISERVKVLSAVLLSIIVSIFFNLDFIYSLGITTDITWPGRIVTGFVISLGSHFVHDLAGITRGIREDKRPLRTDGGIGTDREV